MQNNNLDTQSQSSPHQGTPGAPCRVTQSCGTKCQGERSDSYLYLNSNNSTEISKNLSKLTPYHKKKAYTLEKDVAKFVSQVGINHILFLTLTFVDNIKDNKEASRRFNIFNIHFLSKYIGRWMLVKERQKRGAWHYHILIEVPFDARTGFDFNSYWEIGVYREILSKPLEIKDRTRIKKQLRKAERRMVRNAPVKLRAFWTFCRSSAQKYGFGWVHSAPIKDNVEAISKYVGKYISKHVGERIKEDKGVRLTSTSKDFVNSTPKISWISPGGSEWRRKVKEFAHKAGCFDLYDISRKLGSKWSYIYKDIIMDIENYTQEAVIAFIERYNPDVLKNHKIYKTRILDQGMEVIGSDLIDKDTGEVLF